MKRIAIISAFPWSSAQKDVFGRGFFHLAAHFAQLGYYVDYVMPAHLRNHVAELNLLKECRDLGFQLVVLPDPLLEVQSSSQFVQNSYHLYEWLKMQTYDQVHLSDRGGLGHFSLIARKNGQEFQDTLFAVHMTGATLWAKEENNLLLSQPQDASLSMMERETFVNADLRFSSSRELLRRAQEAGYPDLNCEVLELPFEPLAAKWNPTLGQSCVVWTDFDRAHGLPEILDAIIEAKFGESSKIVFLGQNGSVNGESGTEVLKRWGFQHNINLEVIEAKSDRWSLDYVCQRASSVIIGLSRFEFPYRVLDCLNAGVPTFASQNDHLLSYLSDEGIQLGCFENSSAPIASVLLRKKPIMASHLLPERTEAVKALWKSVVNSTAKSNLLDRGVPVATSQQTDVAVLITHFERAQFLKEALLSLLAQTCPPKQILICDDRSSTKDHETVVTEFKEAFSDQGVQLRLLHNERRLGPGASRNRLAREAKADFILFMDDDNLAKENQLEEMIKIRLQTGAQVVSTAVSKFTDPYRTVWRRRVWTPCGFDLAASIYENQMGDTGFLIERGLFLQMGGFDENPKRRAEDLDFLRRASAAQVKMAFSPTPLLDYRVHERNRSQELSTYEALRDHVKATLSGRQSDRDVFAHLLLSHAYSQNFFWLSQEPPFRIRDLNPTELGQSLDLSSFVEVEVSTMRASAHERVSRSNDRVVIDFKGSRERTIDLNLKKIAAFTRINQAWLLDLSFSSDRASSIQVENVSFQILPFLAGESRYSLFVPALDPLHAQSDASTIQLRLGPDCDRLELIRAALFPMQL